MKKLGIIFTLCMFLSSLIAGVAVAGFTRADDGGTTYPVMQPDRETLDEWIEAYNEAPRAYIEMEGFRVPSPGASLNLLDHLEYVPSERDQGSCDNCWAWSGTGCLEIALDIQRGIKDRLSVQYINSCQKDVIGKTCCRPGWLYDLADFYNATDMAIPWSNTNAHWQDGDKSCDTDCSSISTDPNYPIIFIQETTIPTQTVSQATAIANIKYALNQNKGVWFGFFMPTYSAWSNFTSFWKYDGEDVVYDMDQFCGIPYSFGGHAVLCVGYNDTDPGNSYWVMLNSWGTGLTNNRPNGLFRIDMDMAYDCSYPYYSTSLPAFYWQTLDVTFGPEISVSPTSFDITLPPDSTQDYTLTITNDGDADLSYDISDQATTGMSAPSGTETPASPPGQPGQQIEPLGLEASEPVSFATPPPSTGTAEELAYDDNEAESGWLLGVPGSALAVRFTPSSYPISLQTARICLWPDDPDSDHEPFAVDIYDDDGVGGAPGTLLGSVNTTAANWGWWDVDISGLGITIRSGDFYIAYKQLTADPDCERLSADESDPDGRSWIGWDGYCWYPAHDDPYWLDLDWMIRCVVGPADCPWLSEAPTSGTVAPGASHNITVTINTTGLAAGNYSAEIVIDSNDPDENTTIVPVTLHALLTISGVTTQVDCSPLAGVTVTVYDGAEEKGSTTSDGTGNYTLAASISETGTYTVIASKTGFRDESQSTNISDLGQQYELNFRGETGLVPNSATVFYVLECVNHWLFPTPPCELTVFKVLDAVNAWLYPIT